MTEKDHLDELLNNVREKELLPCPFCGGKAISGLTLDDMGYVVCASNDCWGMAGYLPTESDAVTAWNRGATPPKP